MQQNEHTSQETGFLLQVQITTKLFLYFANYKLYEYCIIFMQDLCLIETVLSGVGYLNINKFLQKKNITFK